MKVAAERPEPIPVYAEMSSINPVILFPGALAARGEAIGKAFVGSLTMGAGQFCTNPGLIAAIDGDGLNAFVKGACEALGEAPAGTMLTAGIHEAYCKGVERLAGHAKVEKLGEGKVGERFQGRAALFATPAAEFLADPVLQEEVFGSSSLIVRCKDEAELAKVVEAFEGQLTIALHMDEGRPRSGAQALAGAGDQGRTAAGQRLRHRRRGRPCDGPWRALPGDIRRPLDLGRNARHQPLPAAGLLPGHAGRTAAEAAASMTTRSASRAASTAKGAETGTPSSRRACGAAVPRAPFPQARRPAGRARPNRRQTIAR